MIKTARAILIPVIGALFLMALPAMAQDTWVIHRGPILDQAVQDYRSGRPNLALQRLRYLLRSSPDAGDEAYLLSLTDQIRRENPWILNGGGAILPSTNIDRNSAHRTFDTQLGQLLIPEGGEPRFGIGLSAWGEAGRVWVTGPGREVSLVAGLTRSIQPVTAQNRNELRLTLAHEAYSRRGQWRVALTAQSGRQDGTLPGQEKVDFDQLSLSLSGIAYQGPKASLSADLTLETNQFLFRSHQSGPAATLGLGLTRALDGRSNLALRVKLGRSLPKAGHLANSSASVTAIVDRSFGDHLTLGGSLELGGSHFDDIFPTLSHARRDGHLALGLSVSDSRLQVFGKVPALNCTWRSARSNVALYEHQSTDCQVSLSVDF